MPLSTGSIFDIVDQTKLVAWETGLLAAASDRGAISLYYAKYDSLKFRVFMLEPSPGQNTTGSEKESESDSSRWTWGRLLVLSASRRNGGDVLADPLIAES